MGTACKLHLEHSFMWSRKLDTSDNRSEIPGNIWNVVLKKDGDHLERSCEKWRSVTWIYRGQEYPACN